VSQNTIQVIAEGEGIVIYLPAIRKGERKEDELIFSSREGRVEVKYAANNDIFIDVAKGGQRLGFDVASIINGGGDRDSWLFLRNLFC